MYRDGIQHNAPIETAEAGNIRFAEDGGALCRVWTNEFFVPRTVTFVPAEADS